MHGVVHLGVWPAPPIALNLLAPLRAAAGALLIDPLPPSNRARRVAREIVTTAAVMLALMLVILFLGPGFAALGQHATDLGRLGLLTAMGVAYGLLYMAALRAHRAHLAAWSSAGLVVIELCLLITLIPIAALYLGPLLPPNALERLTTSGHELFDLVFVLGMFVFAIRGWRRYVARSAQAREAAQAAAFYERLAHEDALTGLPNRRRFEAALSSSLSSALAGGEPGKVALLMIDVNRFKQINDRFSHDVGDAVLKGIARVLQAGVPAHGLAARLAGDEFVVMLAGCSATEAEALASRLAQAVRGHDWTVLHPGLAVGISVGVAVAAPGDTVSSLLRRSDGRMYEAKRATA